MACSQAETVGMELGGAESRNEALGSWLEEEEEEASMTPDSFREGMLFIEMGTYKGKANWKKS